MILRSWISLALLLTTAAACQQIRGPAAPTQKAAVPFQGCASDGQTGPLPAPKPPTVAVLVDASVAEKLSYYKAENGVGVLGPRGWNCVGMYGSSGSSLFVTPSSLNIDTWESITASVEGARTGPAIEVSAWSGETSGRFQVARIVADVFPASRGSYRNDRLVYRGNRVVEYETPASNEGLGTFGRLKESQDPILGVAILRGETPDLVLLAVRLPANLTNLATPIMQRVEEEN